MTTEQLRVWMPAGNAVLNSLSAVLLVAGYLAIRNRAITLHKTCMFTALGVSAVFLASYLYYHFVVVEGVVTRFRDRAPEAPEWVAILYAGILLSHTILAVVVAPMALVTAYLGMTDRLTRHVAIARWTLPIWLYVSVTGVVVYWMLYRLYPSP
jgi:uncharacterized membrane protein YozB (DUF420 family)